MTEFAVDAPLPAPEDLAEMSREEQLQVIRAALGTDSSARRMVESQRAVDAFALRLRDEQDREVPTQFITVHRLPDDAAAAERDDVRPIAPGAPRYVIVACLEETGAR
ncbi:MAG TPA: hypothetical protein VIJ16_07950 [Gemmatimonadaceae bacterium]